MANKAARRINLQVFRDFFRSESNGGMVLLGCVAVSLIIANTALYAPFQKFLAVKSGVFFGSEKIEYSILTWINDGLMAVFFLLVGLEIKRELIEGELSSPKQAALPLFAALGGMLVPALIFTLINTGAPTKNGWGVPMATDIAFAIAILAVLNKQAPTALKVFLVGLAIVDDLGAILVIAFFYTAELHIDYLLYAAITFAIQILLNRFGFKKIIYYIIPGVFLWYFIHHSGIHATIAGVLTAFTLPTNPVHEISPLEKLEHALNKPVNFFIMPLFALANTNIRFSSDMLGGFSSPLTIGILLGLFIGKPLGITFFSWLAIKWKLARMPRNTNWPQMLGVGLLGGIGFTMSIFISLLSFSDVVHQEEAKFAILMASLLAGASGFVALAFFHKKKVQKEVA